MKSVRNYFEETVHNWKIALQHSRFRNILLITLAFYFVYFKLGRLIMAELEARKGTQLIDPILQLLPPHDLSVITFTFTYTALSIFIILIVKNPIYFVRGLQGYTILSIMRAVAIFFVNLEPPTGMILLKDPVTVFFMQSKEGGYIVKDLFFSGHVSTIMFFHFLSHDRRLKRALLVIAVIVGTLILFQHVHYTIDVVAAPFFSFLAYKCTLWVNAYVHKDSPVLSMIRK